MVRGRQWSILESSVGPSCPTPRLGWATPPILEQHPGQMLRECQKSEGQAKPEEACPPPASSPGQLLPARLTVILLGVERAGGPSLPVARGRRQGGWQSCSREGREGLWLDPKLPLNSQPEQVRVTGAEGAGQRRWALFAECPQEGAIATTP